MLNDAVGGPSVFPPIAAGAMGGTQIPKAWPTSFGPDRYRRGLYTFTFRSSLHPNLGLLDAPDGTSTCTRRIRSDSPLQALALLNDTAFMEMARALGGRLVSEAGPGDRERLEHGFLLALGRRPTPVEVDRLIRFLALRRDEYQTDPKAAKLLLGGAGDPRAIREAQEAGSAEPGGAQSARGHAAAEKAREIATAELIAGKAAAQKRAAEIEAMDSKTLRERAAWTAISRVLFNLDDFITRN
jgi:hypothetical protein